MNFIGTGRRLAAGDVGNVARSIGIETAVLLAFMEVEANGRGFDGKNRAKILPEPHRFYAELGPGPARDRAVKANLAYPKWGTLPYDKTMDGRYDRLGRMIAIDENDALRAASWGLPQILGSNCNAAGYPTAFAMVEGFLTGELAQLQAMANFLKNEGIARLLTGRDFSKAISWVDAVKRYNGPGYAKNDYHTKCARAYVKHSAGKDEMVEAKTIVLVRNSKGEAVLNMQKDLIAAGYSVGEDGADGRFGPGTEGAVRRFQSDLGLKPVDGKYGRDSAHAMEALLAAAKVDGDPAPPVWEGQEPEEEAGLNAAAMVAEVAEIRVLMDKLSGRLEVIERALSKEKPNEQVDS